MLKCKGLPKALSRHYLFWFHIPVLGGWKNYIVLEPKHVNDIWHVGWKQKNAQISILPITGPIRVLCGSKDVYFFGLNQNGEQIEIHQIGKGKIGDKGEFSKIPLS